MNATDQTYEVSFAIEEDEREDPFTILYDSSIEIVTEEDFSEVAVITGHFGPHGVGSITAKLPQKHWDLIKITTF